jgi:hypothetical protein
MVGWSWESNVGKDGTIMANKQAEIKAKREWVFEKNQKGETELIHQPTGGTYTVTRNKQGRHVFTKQEDA